MFNQFGTPFGTPNTTPFGFWNGPANFNTPFNAFNPGFNGTWPTSTPWSNWNTQPTAWNGFNPWMNTWNTPNNIPTTTPWSGTPWTNATPWTNTTPWANTTPWTNWNNGFTGFNQGTANPTWSNGFSGFNQPGFNPTWNNGFTNTFNGFVPTPNFTNTGWGFPTTTGWNNGFNNFQNAPFNTTTPVTIDGSQNTSRRNVNFARDAA